MKAKITIVDANNSIIGAKERGTLKYNDVYRVSALWLTNSKHEVLLAQRKWTKKNNPGKWGPAVAGTIDEGESYEQNIIKETEEEIGLTGVDFKTGPKLFVDDGEHKFFGQWFTATVDREASDFEIQEEEVEAVRWISLAGLKSELMDNPTEYIGSIPMILNLLEKG